MQPLTDRTRASRAALVGDVVAVLAFCATGLTRHGEGTVGRFLALAAIFVVAWLLVAWAIGTYRSFTPGRVLAQILLAFVLGVAVRTTVVGGLTTEEVLTFAGVAVVFGALFVGVARVITALVLRNDPT